MYIHANIELKEQAMAKTKLVAVPAGRYRPDDKLLTFLEERSDYADNRADKLTLLVVSTVSARHNQKCGIMNSFVK
jgi:hypothetical protein